MKPFPRSSIPAPRSSPPSSLQEIVCCMGQPVAGNPTQFMMERAFSAAGLDWRYLTFEVSPAALADAIRGLRAMGFRGANMTIPHKVAVLPLLDELTPAAAAIGAVNCIDHREGKLIGDNTDGKGFVQALRGTIDPAGKHIVILGAGGAARAVAVELAFAGAAQITIVNRTPARGENLVAAIREKTTAAADYVPLQGECAVPENAQVLVNATSVGLGDERAALPIAKSSLRKDLIVADVVFNPPSTRLLADAAAAGATAVDGLGMLVNQAAIAFEKWTAVKPDSSIMREALEEFLEL